MKNIESKEGREKLMKTFVKLSNRGTSMLRILSSLAFLYLDPKSSTKNYL